MSFARRYVVALLAPPLLIALPLAILFLAQLVDFNAARVMVFVAATVVIYGSGAAIAVAMILRAMRAFDHDNSDAGLSSLITALLVRTETASVSLWLGGGVLWAVICARLLMPSFLGLSYFFEAAMILAALSTGWDYWAAKHLLLGFAKGRAIRYSGRFYSVGVKIAMVFIGFLLVAGGAMVNLISAKVSTTLENLAISSSRDRFQRVRSVAETLDVRDQRRIDGLRELIPSDHAIDVIEHDETGSVLTTSPEDPLTPEEVTEIRRIGKGDSSAFVSPHVIIFAPLKNGSIIALRIPWTPYRNIPVQIMTYTLGIVFLTAIVFCIATWFLARDITGPVKELREAAAEMAQGNFDTASRIFSDDEVGQLAGSFGETSTNLRRLLGRIGGSGSAITEGVRVITGGTDSLLERARDQAEATEDASLSVENVRGGVRGVLSAADTVSALTQDASSRALELQASAEEVARNMDHLFQSVEKTSASTTEMSASMAEMSKRTDVLAGIGDEVLSFVAQMDSTIEELRRTSQSTAEISRQVREDAELGGRAVEKTVDGINLSQDLTNSTADVLDQLQQSAGQISQILNVIEEITGQTNLLALNAAIIAAQAGEHGLGFTVVAGEIRELAERTRGSTKEIGTIVKAVQSSSRQAVAKIHEGVQRVKDNVDLARNASASLAKIVSSATNSYEMATQISGALDEQAKASRHLHEVTSRMSEHSAQMSSATREQARGTMMLAQEAERVREIALQVKNATDEQSTAGRGITTAMERIADDARAMRDLLERQLNETDHIAEAAKMMLDIAQENDATARELQTTVQRLVQSGRDFDAEVGRFRVT